jgi:hypothetical protein
MTTIPAKRTPITSAQAVAVLAAAYERVIGRAPKPATLAILVAQSALETGNWSSMWLWNWGNIRGSYRGVSQTIKGADEIIDGKRVTGAAVEAGFRAYPDAAAGAVDFVRFLAIDTTPDNGRPNRYAEAWACAEAGDVDGYCRELSEAGYYTANVVRYTMGVRALVEQYRPICEAHLRPETDPAPAPGRDDSDLLAALDDAEAAIKRARMALGRPPNV